jgi:acetyl-CoA acetyltransferase
LIFDKDEFPKNDTTLEGLSKLRTAFKKDGTVTAGNASGLNDGAAVNLLASDNAIKEFGLTPKARIISSAVVGVEPKFMGIGPVKAAKLALQKAGLTLMILILLN